LSDQLPQRVELADTPFFPQKDYQCGPAALATVLVTSGVETTADALVPEVYLPGRQGSLQTELIAATRRHERMPYVLAPEFDDLIAEVATGRPVLVLQNLQLRSWPVWHYAVVIGYDRSKEQLVLRSGTTRRQVVSTRKFQRTWTLANRWALVSLQPGEAPAHPDLDRYMSAAAGLEATGKMAAAAASYSRAQVLWPQAALPWLGVANLAYARGDLSAAQAAYIAAIERDPANAAARSNLAQTLAERGCVSAAQREIERALHFARGTSLEDEVLKASRTIGEMPQQETCTGQPP
jgi:Flp pilus assembly protein TadD